MHLGLYDRRFNGVLTPFLISRPIYTIALKWWHLIRQDLYQHEYHACILVLMRDALFCGKQVHTPAYNTCSGCINPMSLYRECYHPHLVVPYWSISTYRGTHFAVPTISYLLREPHLDILKKISKTASGDTIAASHHKSCVTIIITRPIFQLQLVTLQKDTKRK